MTTANWCCSLAPGHGVDDYNAGVRFDIPQTMPVDDDVTATATLVAPSGMEVNEANPVIVLSGSKTVERLYSCRRDDHSYPHCWCCKEPVIFRATSQWFVSMDKTGLRQQAAEELQRLSSILQVVKRRTKTNQDSLCLVVTVVYYIQSVKHQI